jgi:hypothetical protein
MVGFQQVDGVHVLLLGHSRMRAGFERRRHVIGGVHPSCQPSRFLISFKNS